MATPLLRRLAAHQQKILLHPEQPPSCPDTPQRAPRSIDGLPAPLPSAHSLRPRTGSISRPLPPVPPSRDRPAPPSPPSTHYPSRPWPPPPDSPPVRAKPLPQPPPPAPRPISIDSAPASFHNTAPTTVDTLGARRSSVGGPRPAPDRGALARRATRARMSGSAESSAFTREKLERSSVVGTEERPRGSMMVVAEEQGPAMVVTEENRPSLPTVVVNEERPGVAEILVSQDSRPNLPTMVVSQDPGPNLPTMVVTEDPGPIVPTMVVNEDPGPNVPTMVVTEDPGPNVPMMVVTEDLGSNLPTMVISPDIPLASATPAAPSRPSKTTSTMMGPPTCAGCRQLIAGRTVHALDQLWHPACFRCTHCGLDLEHVAFYEHEGLAYCGVDFDELFSLKCHHCNTPITEESYITLDDPSLKEDRPRYYHQLHLFCAECGDPFVNPKKLEERSRISTHSMNKNSSFDNNIKNEDESKRKKEELEPNPFVIYNGYPYCEKCDVKLHLPKCFGCKNAIIGGYLKAIGKVWHEDCFVCMRCKDKFMNDKFFLIDQNHDDENDYLSKGQKNKNKLFPSSRSSEIVVAGRVGKQIAVCEKCF